MNEATQLLLGALVTIVASGGMATIIVRFMERRKVDADTNHTNAQATDVLVQAGEKAVNILTEQLDKALARIEALEKAGLVKDIKIAELETEVSTLKTHVRRLESGT